MRRVKLRPVKLWDNVALLAWALALAFLLSLILFGAMCVGAYVVDEFYTPPVSLTTVVCWCLPNIERVPGRSKAKRWAQCGMSEVADDGSR